MNKIKDYKHLYKATEHSAHPNLLNKTVKNLKIKKMEILKLFCKSLISPILVIFSNKILVDKNNIIYIGNKKKLSNEFEIFCNHSFFKEYYIIDDSMFNITRLSVKKELIYEYLRDYTLLIYLLVVEGSFENKIRAMYSLIFLKHYYKIRSLNLNSECKLLNLFSGSQIGHILNHQLKIFGGRSFIYSWGSNVASEEQKIVSGDVALLKNKYEKELYSIRKQYIVGNISYNQELKKKSINRLKENINLLFIDTCENKNFDDISKFEFYKNIFIILLKFDYVSVNIRMHPGSEISTVQKLIEIFDSERINITCDNVSLEQTCTMYDAVINVNSSLSALYVLNYMPIINLFPLYFNMYENTCSKNVYKQFFDLPGKNIYFIDDLFDLLCSVKKINKFLNDFTGYDKYRCEYIPKSGKDTADEIAKVMLSI
ncbi:hypothetical protein NLG07_07805 [Alteromonas sp. LMIT006]|uniref:hypothetical protein n=1 Tax=Alteromonadaceae TaxID=72275 RepID=UPI0020CA94F7|nr:hypothetical protein [Alteromonas sp. LMIT006]UTP71914.1 hypothetical protein NLG07_07805 [Alteromonas sp. LMIT006]